MTNSSSVFKAWEVFQNKEHIDTVFYVSGCQADYVWQGLVKHDGYDPGITVWCRETGEVWPEEYDD